MATRCSPWPPGPFRQGLGRNVPPASAPEVEVMDFGRRAPVDPARLAERTVRRQGPRDPSGALHPCRHRDFRRCRTRPRSARRLDEAGHPALLLSDNIRVAGLRPLRDGRLGGRRHGRGLPEGSDDPAGHVVRLFQQEKPMPRANRAGTAAPPGPPTGTGGPGSGRRNSISISSALAPTHHLYGLRAALDMIGEEGDRGDMGAS